MKLEDGKGRGFIVEVDPQNRIHTYTVSESEERDINIRLGKVWSAIIDAVPIIAGAYVAYMKNTGNTNLHMVAIRAHMNDAASRYNIDVVSGTPGGATGLLPTDVNSRNLGTLVKPVGEMYRATAAIGITGLTKASTLFYAGDLDRKSSMFSTASDLIITPGTAIAIKVLTANTTLGVTMTGTFAEIIEDQ